MGNLGEKGFALLTAVLLLASVAYLTLQEEQRQLPVAYVPV